MADLTLVGLLTSVNPHALSSVVFNRWCLCYTSSFTTVRHLVDVGNLHRPVSCRAGVSLKLYSRHACALAYMVENSAAVSSAIFAAIFSVDGATFFCPTHLHAFCKTMLAASNRGSSRAQVSNVEQLSSDVESFLSKECVRESKRQCGEAARHTSIVHVDR